MIPSRGPIQVRLEETGGPRLQCKPPVQVKILRRPQPAAHNATSNNNQTNTATASNVTHLDRFADSPFDDVTTDEFSPITNTMGQTSEQQNGINRIRAGQLNYSTVAATNIRKEINSNHAAQIDQQQRRTTTTVLDRSMKSFDKPVTNSSSSTVGSSSPSSSSSGHTINKKPPKTYQERADEYAKARLRILGSAFPENEDLSGTSEDDVNRILNF